MVVWLQACSKRFVVSPYARRAARKVEAMWHGAASAASHFRSELQALVVDSQVELVPVLLASAKEQHKHHVHKWSQEKSVSYAGWLKNSCSKGMRPLFKSVKSDETITVRPFLDAPVQERICLRWRQWFDLWSHPAGVDPELLASLHCTGIPVATDFLGKGSFFL